MSIILKDDIPVCQRARRLSCSEKLQVNDQIDDWLQQALQALAVETEKKSDRFEQTSRTLERKISMRSTKEELNKKGVLTPDGTDKDQDSKINDSVHQNHIPQINGFGPESGMSETEKQRNSPSVTYTSSSVLETYNTVVVTNSGFPTVLSSSQNHAMPVIHNVSLLNLPDVEEVPSYDGEIVLSVLPEPPISLNDIGPILHPQQQTT
ncbi:phosphatase and actin regulator 2 [Trichonephila clavipes]|nr:phosphatase and actin regulator 2 [Trichonephila clavipes]